MPRARGYTPGMIGAAVRAVSHLGDARFRAVVWRALAVAVAVFAALWGLAWWGLDAGGTALAVWLGPDSWWGWAAEWLVALGGVAAVLVTSFVLFPAVMGMAQQLFLEDAAAVAEAGTYPDLPAADEQPFWEGVRDGLRLAVVTVIVNLLVLPLYLVLFPPLNLVLFYAVNGYLLGREYFEVVAARRLTGEWVTRLRRRHAGRVTLAGVVIAVLMTLPVLNLLAPAIAAAFMVHVVERLRRRAGLPATRAAS